LPYNGTIVLPWDKHKANAHFSLRIEGTSGINGNMYSTEEFLIDGSRHRDPEKMFHVLSSNKCSSHLLDPITAGMYCPAVSANHGTAKLNPPAHMKAANCRFVLVPSDVYAPHFPKGILPPWPHITPIELVKSGGVFTVPYSGPDGEHDKLFFPIPPAPIPG
jgi:hypothetical protein